MDEFQHLTYLIEKKHIFIFALIENMKPKAFYFFRNNYTTIEDTYQDPSHYGAPRSIKIGLEIRY